MPRKQTKLIPFDGLAQDKGISLSRRQIERLVAAKKFPAPIKIGFGGHGRIAWAEAEIDAWIGARLADRDEGRRARR